MRYPWIDEYLLQKPAVEKDLQAEWNWIRYKVGGKMFAAICLDDADRPYYITLKLAPANVDFYRQQYPDVLLGYYMNKVHWNSVYPDKGVPYEVIQEMCSMGYDLILHSFSKKAQAERLG